MVFAAPWALAGLGAALIPILLHLFARREPPTVMFPATRYLADTARLHQRTLRLQHLLLLLARTLLIVALVLAAAGPSLPTGGIGSHAPSAVAVVLDNSLSSGAVRGGTPTIDQIKSAAREVLGRATAEDRLWLVAADGIPRQGDRATLGRMVDSTRPSLLRLDLGQAVSAARGLIVSSGLPGEVIVISDLQATALGPAAGTSAVIVLRPQETVIANAGISSLSAGSQPWGLESGLATIALTGSENRSVPALIGIEGKQSKQALVPVGSNGSVRLTPPANGWWALTATLDPDELRGDDRRSIALRVAPPARVTWQPGDRFIAAALDVLAASGRVGHG
ncbi:MAG: BatA and WFA domain-containing protein, partial [Gemmatimonadota bacterium]